eukprot:4949225-Pyramimonas_sp.AAC.1
MAFVGLSWEPSGGSLGFLWAVSVLSGAVLGPPWAAFKPSRGPLGLSWGEIGGPLGRLARCEDPKSGYAQQVYFLRECDNFGFFGAL